MRATRVRALRCSVPRGSGVVWIARPRVVRLWNGWCATRVWVLTRSGIGRNRTPGIRLREISYSGVGRRPGIRLGEVDRSRIGSVCIGLRKVDRSRVGSIGIRFRIVRRRVVRVCEPCVWVWAWARVAASSSTISTLVLREKIVVHAGGIGRQLRTRDVRYQGRHDYEQSHEGRSNFGLHQRSPGSHLARIRPRRFRSLPETCAVTAGQFRGSSRRNADLAPGASRALDRNDLRRKERSGP